MSSGDIWYIAKLSLLAVYTLAFWPVVIFLALGLICFALQVGFVGLVYMVPVVWRVILTACAYLVVFPFTVWSKTAWKNARNRIHAGIWRRPQPRGEDTFESGTESHASKPEAKKPTTDDPHFVLGVPLEANATEIKKAFRQKMMMNHPDKLSGLDPELQKIANDRTVKITKAYERLISRV